MAITLRETIKSIVKDHLLNKKGKAYGQCLTAVGWVGGTLPELYEEDGMVELSMADVAGGAIVVGASLAGNRPIYVVRYQGFQWYNCVSIVNYASKSKSIWKRPCPVFRYCEGVTVRVGYIDRACEGTWVRIRYRGNFGNR